MIRGRVNARNEPIVSIRIRGPLGETATLEATVDSGYTGSLTVSPRIVGELGLIRQSGGKAVLADGTVREIDCFSAGIEWHDGWRSLLISSVSGGSLLGMRAMSKHELRIRVEPCGFVEIIPVDIPRSR